MKIPPSSISPAGLQGIVEEFVTRDGTDHSNVEQRVIEVLQQLQDGQVELHFDREANTCNIVAVEN